MSISLRIAAVAVAGLVAFSVSASDAEARSGGRGGHGGGISRGVGHGGGFARHGGFGRHHFGGHQRFRHHRFYNFGGYQRSCYIWRRHYNPVTGEFVRVRGDCYGYGHGWRFGGHGYRFGVSVVPIPPSVSGVERPM